MTNFMICNSADQQVQHINESDGEKYVLTGEFARLNELNRNSRIYTEDEYLKHLSYLRDDIKSGDGLLGELDHPDDRFEVKLKEASHKITDLWYDKDKHAIMGKIELLDTPNGKIAKALVDEGVPLHISSRAAGTVNPDNTVDIQQIYTYDLVAKPGFASAVLHRVNESEENTQYSAETRDFLKKNEIMEARNLASTFGLNESEVGITPMNVSPKLRKEVREVKELETTAINNTETKNTDMTNKINESIHIDNNHETTLFIDGNEDELKVFAEHAADLQRFLVEHNIQTVNIRLIDKDAVYHIDNVHADINDIMTAIKDVDETNKADVVNLVDDIESDYRKGDNVIVISSDECFHDNTPTCISGMKKIAGTPVIDFANGMVYMISNTDSEVQHMPLFNESVNEDSLADEIIHAKSDDFQLFPKKESPRAEKRKADLMSAVQIFVKEHPESTEQERKVFGLQWVKEHPLSMYAEYSDEIPAEQKADNGSAYAGCKTVSEIVKKFNELHPNPTDADYKDAENAIADFKRTNECNASAVSEDESGNAEVEKTDDNAESDGNKEDDKKDDDFEIIDVKVISDDDDKKDDDEKDDDKNDDSEDDKSDDDQHKEDDGNEEKTDECDAAASTEKQEQKVTDSNKLNDSTKSELKKDKSAFLEKIANLTAAIEKKNKTAKECKNESQIMAQYPVSMMLNESNFAKFLTLSESQKNKVTAYLKNNEITDRETINEQWTAGLTANEEPVWLKFAPENYRKLYESAPENVKNSLKNTAEYVLFENQHDINVFWENSGLERSEETRILNESFISNMPKIAAKPVNEPLPYGNGFIQQIANMACEYN